MGHFVQRFGFEIGRGWVIGFLVVLAVVVGAYWVGPLKPPPPEIELLAVQDGQLVDRVRVAGERDPATNAVRFGVALAARNVGAREGDVEQLVLSVPARYRLVTPRGRARGEVTTGVALRRYVLDVPVNLEPGAPPQRLAGLDSIWLEPDLPSYYCYAQTADIPEFIPAPSLDPATISEVRIFYSFATRGVRERSTGLLTLDVAPDQLEATSAEMPPAFPTVFEDPEIQQPDMGRVQYGGARTAWCGDPEQPLELYTVRWDGQGGARLYAIHVRESARKLLWDLNGDGVVDLEAWDVDGDGRFEARREARFPVPDFLEPLPPRNPEWLEPDTSPRDAAWLAVFNNTGAGPFRFAGVPTPAERLAADTLVTDTLPADSAGVSARPMAPAGTQATLEPLPPPDSAWLALFLDADAGPFRFTRGRPAPQRAEQPVPTPPAQGTPAPTSPAADAPQAVDAEADEPEPEPAPQPAPAPRRRVPIGTPVPPGGGL